jgi:hypothetical protein
MDAIGCVLVGLGLAKQFADVDFVPASVRFGGYGLAFIILGAALMVPPVTHLIHKMRQRGRAREDASAQL